MEEGQERTKETYSSLLRVGRSRGQGKQYRSRKVEELLSYEEAEERNDKTEWTQGSMYVLEGAREGKKDERRRKVEAYLKTEVRDVFSEEE